MKITIDDANRLYNYFKEMPYCELKDQNLLLIVEKLDKQRDIPDQPENWYMEVALLLQKGMKIQAIKEIRSRTGYGLKEAKEMADLVCKNLAAAIPAWGLLYNVDFDSPIPVSLSDRAIVQGIYDEAKKLPNPVV